MADPADDPLRTMVVEEVIRDDGRYLVYYRWPEGAEPDDRARDDAARDAARSDPDV